MRCNCTAPDWVMDRHDGPVFCDTCGGSPDSVAPDSATGRRRKSSMNGGAANASITDLVFFLLRFAWAATIAVLIALVVMVCGFGLVSMAVALFLIVVGLLGAVLL